MFSRFRRRPQAFYTPSRREHIIPQRRHSYSGRRERDYDADMDDEDRHFEQDRRILAENYTLSNDNQRLMAENQRLLRNYQALSRQMHDLLRERDSLVIESQRHREQEWLIQDLEQKLRRERRRSREDRALQDSQFAEKERRLRCEITRLRARAAELIREAEEWFNLSREKDRRIRDLEELLRRLPRGFR